MTGDAVLRGVFNGIPLTRTTAIYLGIEVVLEAPVWFILGWKWASLVGVISFVSACRGGYFAREAVK